MIHHGRRDTQFVLARIAFVQQLLPVSRRNKRTFTAPTSVFQESPCSGESPCSAESPCSIVSFWGPFLSPSKLAKWQLVSPTRLHRDVHVDKGIRC